MLIPKPNFSRVKLTYKKLFKKLWYIVPICAFIGLLVIYLWPIKAQTVYGANTEIILDQTKNTSITSKLFKDNSNSKRINLRNMLVLIKKPELSKRICIENNLYIWQLPTNGATAKYATAKDFEVEFLNDLVKLANAVFVITPLKNDVLKIKIKSKDLQFINSFSDTILKKFPIDTVINIKDGQWFEIDNCILKVKTKTKVEKNTNYSLAFTEPEKFARILSLRIMARPLDINTTIMAVRFFHTSKELAEVFVTKLAEGFISGKTNKKQKSAIKAIKVIDYWLAYLKIKGDKLNQELDIGESLLPYGNYRIADYQLGSQKTYAQNVLINKQINKKIYENKKHGTDTGSTLNFYARTKGEGKAPMFRYKDLFMKHSLSDETNSMFLTPLNPAFKSHKKTDSTVKYILSENIDNLLNMLEGDIKYIENEIKNIDAIIETIPESADKIEHLLRGINILADLSMYLTSQKLSIQIQMAEKTVNEKILNKTYITEIEPMPLSFYYAMGTVGGVFLGFSIIFFLAINQNKIFTEKELSEYLMMPILGSAGQLPKNSNELKLKRNVLDDSYRQIITFLKMQEKENISKKSLCFCITSSVSGEGKTFTTNNFAETWSSQNKKVLIINADLHKDTNKSSQQNQLGLSDYLLHPGTNIDNIIQPTAEYPNVFKINSGNPALNPGALFQSDIFVQLINNLRPHFDAIFIDTPPLNLVSDYFLISLVSDYTLFITRYGYTRREFLTKINQVYKTQNKANHRMYAIFNGVEASANKYYNYNYYY